MMFLRTVKTYIENKALILPNQNVLVAVSGGADSVALLRVLLSLGYPCEVAHCNFHLRGEESDRDAFFVRELCKRLQIPFHYIDFDTMAYAQAHHLSIEMAARELRYDWFAGLRTQFGLDVVAVAHHRDDSVETFLLNLIRGTGLNGLRGIPARNGYIIRPLLAVSRKDILDYLKSIQQDYVTDSTNLQDEFKRNKIRLNVLPLLQIINPSVCEKIAETASYLSDVADVYNTMMKSVVRKVLIQNDADLKVIDIAALQKEISPSLVLFEILSPLGFNAAQIKDISNSLNAQSGKQFYAGAWVLLHDRMRLIVSAKKEESAIPQLDLYFANRDEHFHVSSNKSIAYLDADKLTLPLTVRRWQKGDKFVPLGMTGKKNVSDYLTDKKFTLFEKENQYVACSGQDIVWLIGERIDNRFCVTDKTKRVLILHILK